MIGLKVYVDQLLDPVYSWMYKYWFFITIFIVFYVEITIIKKISQSKKAKKWESAPYGDTNDWFKIEGWNTGKQNEPQNETIKKNI